MKTKSISLAIIVLAVFSFGLNAIAQNKTPPAKNPIASIADLDGFFTEAKASFIAKNNNKVYMDINKAAVLLSNQARASTVSKVFKKQYGKPLAEQATELNNLAFDVRAGKVSKEAVLDQEFAKTHKVLAAYFQSEATRSIAEKAKDKAATAMTATANHIEATAKWSSQKLSDSDVETVSLLRKTSAAIAIGTGTAVEKSKDALKRGKKLIKNLDKVIKKKN